MPISNKNVLVAPVNLEEVYDYMGVTSSNGIYDVVAICTSGKINKWAKHKPIRYPKFEVLTENERAGSTQDKMNGIFYGVKLAGVAGDIEDMHSVTFDYYGVRDGVDWSRLSDFDGYDKNAKPNPVGALPEVIYVDLPNAVGEVTIVYSTGSTTGVDVSEAISIQSNESFDLGDFYPCVLATIDGVKYARALWNGSVEMTAENMANDSGYTTMRVNGAWHQLWRIIMDGLPGAKDGKQITTTIFFIRRIKPTQATSAINMTTWVNVVESLSPYNGYACPEAVAKTIMLKNFYSKGVDIVGGTWSKRDVSAAEIRIQLLRNWVEPQEDVEYHLEGWLYGSGESIPITNVHAVYRYVPGQLQLDEGIVVDIGTIGTPTTSVFKLVWTIRPSANSDIIYNSGTTDLTYQS